MRQRGGLRQVPGDAIDLAILNALEHLDQPVDVHGLTETILNRLLYQRMVWHLAISRNVLQASQLVGKHRGQQIFRFHAL